MCYWLLIVLLASVLLAACGGDNTGPQTETPVATGTREVEVDGTCLAGESRQPILAACEELAQRFDENPGDVTLISAQPREWPDSCLGVAASGEACDQIITPGFEVVLGLTSQTRQFVYHTNEGDKARLATVRLSEGNELVVRGEEPVAFDFTTDGRLLFTERQLGEIRIASYAEQDQFGEVWADVPMFRGSECGLLGIAVDPEFASNGFVYVYVTQPAEDRSDVGTPRVIRYTDSNGRGTNPTVIVGDLPTTNQATCAHVAGNLHFGPDGYLYLSVGNFERPETSADLAELTGKILRVSKTDGSAAPDNPFVDDPAADPRVFAYGLRNPFDFAFNPATGTIYAPDNGPGNCDELNVIEAGSDYGVPRSLETVREIDSCLGLGGLDPIYLFSRPEKQAHEFGSNVAPAGVAYLRGANYPKFGEGLLVCEFVPHELHLLKVEGPAANVITGDTLINDDCNFNVEVGPDELIYYSDRQGIFRIPAQQP